MVFSLVFVMGYFRKKNIEGVWGGDEGSVGRLRENGVIDIKLEEVWKGGIFVFIKIGWFFK